MQHRLVSALGIPAPNAILVTDQLLSLAIEKDFACLDHNDAENEDTFPNPNLAAAC
jgi:hypothetical protein